jgi:hypothetical protein
LGGKEQRDGELPGQPIVDVSLRDTKATDSDLKELKCLRWLELVNTQITDAGLKDLGLALPTTKINGF